LGRERAQEEQTHPNPVQAGGQKKTGKGPRDDYSETDQVTKAVEHLEEPMRAKKKRSSGKKKREIRARRIMGECTSQRR